MHQCFSKRLRSPLADALSVVTNPESTDARRLLAWATLKSARGQSISQVNLHRLQTVQRHQRRILTDMMFRKLGGAA